MTKQLHKVNLQRKFLFYVCLQSFFLTYVHGQVTFDPQPSFFRNQREMPFISLTTNQDILVSAYGAIKNDGLNDLVAIQAAITAARSASSASNPVRVVFENGIYDIMPPTSSATHSLFVTFANNIVFEGNGAEIRNHNPSIGFFEVRSCTNVIFKNLNFDYAVLPFTQGIVTSKNVSNNTFTVRIDDGFPLLSESYFTDAPQRWGCLKDATGKLKAGANNLYPYIGWTTTTTARTFRISTPNSTYNSNVDIGDYFVQIARNNGKTIFNTVAGKNVTYLDINIYSSPAGSFNGQENREFNIINCKVIPKPGSGRVQSGNADIIHVTGSVFGPWVQGCRFEAYTDDAVNLKHTTRDILEVVSPTVIKVRFSVATTDKVVIFNPRTGLPIATPNAVTNVVNLGNNIYQVTFDGNHNVTVVGEHQTADKVYLTNSACESSVFRNNVIKNGRRFGMLLQSSYTQVKNCTFENTSSSAIKIENHVDWGEGYIANNIELTNNSFINCGFDSSYIQDPNAAAISTVVSKLILPCTTTTDFCGTEPVQNQQDLNNITITNNNIVYNKTGINIQNIDVGVIKSNTYTHNPQDNSLAVGELPINLRNTNNSNLIFEPSNTSTIGEDNIKLITNKDFLTIIKQTNESKNYIVTLTDSLGQILQTKMFNEILTTLNVSAYQTGWYLLTLENNNIKTSVKIIL